MDKGLKITIAATLALFFLMVGKSIATVMIAARDHTPPVERNYYEKGLVYGQAMKKRAELKEEGYSIEFSLPNGAKYLNVGPNSVDIRFLKSGNPVEDSQIKFRVTRAASDKLNQMPELKQVSPGHYRAEFDLAYSGEWFLEAFAKKGEIELEKRDRRIAE